MGNQRAHRTPPALSFVSCGTDPRAPRFVNERKSSVVSFGRQCENCASVPHASFGCRTGARTTRGAFPRRVRAEPIGIVSWVLLLCEHSIPTSTEENHGKVYAPASIGNVGVGFDVLGAAVASLHGPCLGDCVSVKHSGVFSLRVVGSYAETLIGRTTRNVAYKCWKHYCAIVGKPIRVSITLEKNVPIGSGLGSSASSIVGTLFALNTLCGNPLDTVRLISLMGEMERTISGGQHWDNIIACFFGGMQLLIQRRNVVSQALPNFDWLWIVAYPGTVVTTAESRSTLPMFYSRHDCVRQTRYLAGFVHSCHSGQESLAAEFMKDVVAEPYRMNHLSDFPSIKKDAVRRGALSVGISGSGPTLFAVCNRHRAARSVQRCFAERYLKNEHGFVDVCSLDVHGVRVLTRDK